METGSEMEGDRQEGEEGDYGYEDMTMDGEGYKSRRNSRQDDHQVDEDDRHKPVAKSEFPRQ